MGTATPHSPRVRLGNSFPAVHYEELDMQIKPALTVTTLGLMLALSGAAAFAESAAAYDQSAVQSDEAAMAKDEAAERQAEAGMQKEKSQTAAETKFRAGETRFHEEEVTGDLTPPHEEGK